MGVSTGGRETQRISPEEVIEDDTSRGVWKEDQGREEGREGGIRLVEAIPRRENELGSGEKEHKGNVPSGHEDRDQGEPSMEEKEMLEEGPACRVGQAWEKGELPALLTILERVQIYVYRGMFQNQTRKAWSAHHYMRLLQFQEYWRRQRTYMKNEWYLGILSILYHVLHLEYQLEQCQMFNQYKGNKNRT